MASTTPTRASIMQPRVRSGWKSTWPMSSSTAIAMIISITPLTLAHLLPVNPSARLPASTPSGCQPQLFRKNPVKCERRLRDECSLLGFFQAAQKIGELDGSVRRDPGFAPCWSGGVSDMLGKFDDSSCRRAVRCIIGSRSCILDHSIEAVLCACHGRLGCRVNPEELTGVTPRSRAQQRR